MGFDTERMACFIASHQELRGALPGWRVPLAAPISRMGRNPFTGKPLLVRTRDPGPDELVAVPATLPFEHALLPNIEDWESRYVALDLALHGELGPAPDYFIESQKDIEDDALWQVMLARGLREDALLGGGSLRDPRWVYSVPSRITDTVVLIDEFSLESVLADWNARSPSASVLEDLRDLWSLARKADAQGREMFLWLDAPAHRCQKHRPHRNR